MHAVITWPWNFPGIFKGCLGAIELRNSRRFYEKRPKIMYLQMLLKYVYWNRKQFTSSDSFFFFQVSKIKDLEIWSLQPLLDWQIYQSESQILDWKHFSLQVCFLKSSNIKNALLEPFVVDLLGQMGHKNLTWFYNRITDLFWSPSPIWVLCITNRP